MTRGPGGGKPADRVAIVAYRRRRQRPPWPERPRRDPRRRRVHREPARLRHHRGRRDPARRLGAADRRKLASLARGVRAGRAAGGLGYEWPRVTSAGCDSLTWPPSSVSSASAISTALPNTNATATIAPTTRGLGPP